MRRSATLLLAVTGCSQIFGIDPPAYRGDGGSDSSGIDKDGAVDTSITTDAQITVTFQEGVDGYNGTVDTYLDSGTPNQGNGTDGVLRWKSSARWGLLRFDGLGIPVGATIIQARVELVMTNSNAAGEVREVLIDWPEGVAYNTFGLVAGIDGDVGNVIAPAPAMDGPVTLDVKASIQAYVNGTAANHGWIFIATSGNESSVRSANDGLLANRPRLVVTYTP